VDRPLTQAEVRVLGSLIEKEVTTPDTYPLSLNALVNACNQSSNREPVMQLDEDAVAAAIEGLRQQNLARVIRTSGSRVNKYQQLMSTRMDLEAPEVAVMCVLMLRGPQTVGELRTRTDRLHGFGSLEDVEATLGVLSIRNPPLVVRLPRHPGQKEQRYAQLMAGEVTYEEPTAEAPRPPGADRIGKLEETVAELRREVADLRAELQGFRRQFE
jgi:uncharacterized protein YceH (UPF0502 family)